MGLSSGLFAVGSAPLEGLRSAPIRVMVADADTVTCRLIGSVLQDAPDVTVDFVDHTTLIAAIQTRLPDIVILDIHNPAIRRAESWESLGIAVPPATIVTAYDTRSASPFASRANGLLVKPFDAEEFQSALDLAKSQLARLRIEAQARAVAPAGQQHVLPSAPFLHRLAIEEGEKIVLVRTADIEWMQASGNQIRLHVGKTSHLLRQSMKKLHALLDPSRFLRVHRNAIVNLDHVAEFHLPTIGNMFVMLRNGFCLPLRKSNRPLLRRMLISSSSVRPTQLT